MKLFAFILCVAVIAVHSTSIGLATLEKRANPKGIDVSGHQPNINWASVKANGVSFAYIKATEGTIPNFRSNIPEQQTIGIIRGGYHFALPNESSGAAQAKFFVAHGALLRWLVSSGRTLPGALDIEYNPYGATCYGLSASAMVAWIKDFSNTYHASTSRFPVIYTTTDWWKTCTGNNPSFASTNPLWVARYASAVGALPAGWTYHTFWQYANKGPNPGDQNVFNGDDAGLKSYKSKTLTHCVATLTMSSNTKAPSPVVQGVAAALASAPPSRSVLSQFSLINNVGLVTGGHRGIGLEIALALAEAGAIVYCLDLPSEPDEDWQKVKAYAAELPPLNGGHRGKLQYVSGDVTNQAGIWKIAEDIATKEGRLDICIANAGILRGAECLEYPAEDFRKVRAMAKVTSEGGH
ncbi:hypothetical protein H0H87_010038 [Tephrocybe sp. NHM501043]|nr:hypothetical protein H0H87_010038 [Tephrocybe sp. NHM501043]